jgi:hypothetical protein
LEVCNEIGKTALSVAGIATVGGVDGRRKGIRVAVGAGFFFFRSISSRPILEHTQTHIKWVPEALSARLKLPEREADHASNYYRGKKYADLYIQSHIRLLYLSTETILPFFNLYLQYGIMCNFSVGTENPLS